MPPTTIVGWNEIIAYMWNQPPGSILRIPAIRTEHPCAGGLVLTFGLPVGQRANYAGWFTDGSMLEVTDFGTYYDVTVHHAPPPPPPIRVEPFLREAPGASVLGLTALGALAGLALGRSGEGALVGAVIGGTAGLAAVAVGNAAAAPEMSRQATNLIATIGKALADRGSSPGSSSAASRPQGSGRRPKSLPAAKRRKALSR